MLNKSISLEMAKMAIWAYHHNRPHMAVIAFKTRGVTLTEDEIYRLGDYWATAARVYTQKDCFFCGSDRYTGICACITPLPVPTPEYLKEFQAVYPDNWRTLKVDRCLCYKCSSFFEVPLGVVAKRYASGRTWTTPKYCKACWATASTKPQPNWNNPNKENSPAQELIAWVDSKFRETDAGEGS